MFLLLKILTLDVVDDMDRRECAFDASAANASNAFPLPDVIDESIEDNDPMNVGVGEVDVGEEVEDESVLLDAVDAVDAMDTDESLLVVDALVMFIVVVFQTLVDAEKPWDIGWEMVDVDVLLSTSLACAVMIVCYKVAPLWCFVICV